MQLASSSTTPSSLGRPPYPTLVSRGSSSRILTPAIAASRVSLPPLISSMALAQQLMPPLNELALDTTTLPGRAWAAAFRARGSAATLNITARLLRLMSFMKILLRLWRHNGRPLRPNANGAQDLRKSSHYVIRQAGGSSPVWEGVGRGWEGRGKWWKASALKLGLLDRYLVCLVPAIGLSKRYGVTRTWGRQHLP